MSAAADVVVVGAGVVGRWSALELARRGAGRVLVLDRGDRCAGTRRSAAVLRSVSADPVERELSARGLELYRAEGMPVRWTGAVVVVPAGGAAAGRPRPLERDELAIRLPWYRQPDGAVAYHDPSAGTADPVLVLAALRAALLRHRVRLERGAASGLLVEAGRVTGVVTGAGAIPCGAVLVAAGHWTRELLATAGVAAPITVTRTALLVLDAPLTPPLPLVDLAAGVLVRPYGRGRTLVGTRRSHPGQQGAWRAEVGPALAILRAVAPRLAGAGVRQGWFGLYDMTPGERPLVGPVEGVRGLHVAAGFSGGGFKTAPAVAELAAGAVLAA
jgi:glycine/D-amino acid oxidase-like deaminating enzyme